MRSIYSGRNTDAGFRSVAMIAAVLGMSRGWSVDPGRLCDGIAEMLQANDPPIDAGAGMLEGAFQPDRSGCSHGLEGIFGHTFCKALADSGAKLEVTIPYVATPDRITIGEFRFTLV